jgi:hypothetical protein
MEIKRKNQIQPLADVSTLIERCPFCDLAFQPREVSVIGDQVRTQLLHAICTRCGSAVVILLLIADIGIHSVGFLTDCTNEDVTFFKDQPAVTGDDVLAVHQALQAGLI